MEQAKVLLAMHMLVAVAVPGCSGLYYQVRPSINITADSWPSVADVGDYDPDYSVTRSDISKADLYVIDDPYFGCPGYTPSNTSQFNTTLPRRGAYFVVMLPYLGLNSRCLEFEKAKTARNKWGAAGLIFRYNRDDPQGGKLRSKPSQSPGLSGITIVTMKLSDARSSPLSNGAGNHPHVTIVAHYHQFQASQTFYFIVFAFCILMLLSCLWFVMSYIKRCHYKIQRRRRRVRKPKIAPSF